ncbi:TetR/AcrR family transcriptional regulator [Bacillus massilinigeriensis]|uniref:TetR/AcrR family transcriptional regulator n=1 Tax=Bacillus massilionigeriensis TaxID=1805475 RepID=UPI0013562A70|nr:TetR/AcrR family transcriptional regulator [Bacillus massilionigeriensis]
MTSKKEKILQTALELFTEQGFKATTTKEIALKSGVAEGLIFYYFKDKNELLHQLTREFSFIETISKEIKELSVLEPHQALIKIGHFYSDFLSQNKNFLFFIWSPEMIQSKEVSKEVVELIQSMFSQISMHLARAVKKSVNEQSIQIAASMYLSTLFTHFIVEVRTSENLHQDTQQYIESVVDLILKGLQGSH